MRCGASLACDVPPRVGRGQRGPRNVGDAMRRRLGRPSDGPSWRAPSAKPSPRWRASFRSPSSPSPRERRRAPCASWRRRPARALTRCARSAACSNSRARSPTHQGTPRLHALIHDFRS